MKWRVGNKVPVNVYDGDRPVCQCQTALDAKRIVRAVNLDTHPLFQDAIDLIREAEGELENFNPGTARKLADWLHRYEQFM